MKDKKLRRAIRVAAAAMALMAVLAAGFAEERPNPPGNTMRRDHCALAWTDRYVFMAIDNYLPFRPEKSDADDGWYFWYWNLVRFDRGTGEGKVVFSNQYGEDAPEIWTEGDALYLLWHPDNEIGSLLQKMDFEGRITEAYYCFGGDDAVLDTICRNGYLYLLDAKGIREWKYDGDPLDGDRYVYRADPGRIMNGDVSPRAILYEDMILFEEDEAIRRLDLSDGSVTAITENRILDRHFYTKCLSGDYGDRAWEGHATFREWDYDYVVIGGSLYYDDPVSGQLTSCDLATMETEPVSGERFYFDQVSEDGVTAVSYAEEKYYDNHNGLAATRPVKYFFPYADNDTPAFDPDQGPRVRLPFEDWYVSIGNGEYIRPDLWLKEMRYGADPDHLHRLEVYRWQDLIDRAA